MKQLHSVVAGDTGLEFSTGTLAKQANGAVTVRQGDTTVFVSATAANDLRPGQDFFPLTVDYREKFAAAGRFPGGYFKREGRPSEKEILTCRLCDRPLRPLFPKGFLNEVQVIGFLLSVDGIHDGDLLMVNGASAALMISDIPWNGPVAGVRVGRIEGKFVANPTVQQQFDSDLDLIYVGTRKEMLMIEGSADTIPEEEFLKALDFAHESIQPIIDAQEELAKMAAKPKKTFPLYTLEPEILDFVRSTIGEPLKEAVFTIAKTERREKVSALKEQAAKALEEKYGEEGYDANQLMLAMETLQEEIYREGILQNKSRVDGRAPEDLRQITSEVDVLPIVHGSALFSRGETQALAIATLGGMGDAQTLDAISGGAKSKSFTLHYNFPPYSVGETGRFGSPGRREIGHGALAERSLLPVIPAEEDFPYSIRIVSEIMESNGSTSMASVCGGCLALMDAGVPIISPVAGISVGLVTRHDDNGDVSEHVMLTDIIGDEDHFGDMDFKICGTAEGITGFQLDLKIKGLPRDITHAAIKRSREVRLMILEKMKAAIDTPRKELKESAPRIVSIKIDPDKIGMLIGPGGKNIRRITELSGATIEINEDNSGRVSIYSTNSRCLDVALEEINLLTAEIEVGKTYRGVVKAIKDFGCFVEVLPGKEGMVHISELADFRVKKVEDVCRIGEEMWVKCVGIDDKGRVRLSRKAALAEIEQNEGGGESSEEEGEEEPEEVKS